MHRFSAVEERDLALARKAGAVGRPVAQVALALVDEAQRLQPAATRQLAADIGQETVEQAVGPIFGQIDDSGPWIDDRRFMDEAAHGGEGDGIDQAGRARWHLEHPAMRPADQRCVLLQRLLAGQPTAPRRRAAGAISAGAGKAEVRTHDTLGPHVPDQRAGAAKLGIPVRREVEDFRPGNGWAIGVEGAALVVVRPDFMVAHQRDLVGSPANRE